MQCANAQAMGIWDPDLIKEVEPNVYRLSLMTLMFVTIQLSPSVDLRMWTDEKVRPRPSLPGNAGVLSLCTHAWSVHPVFLGLKRVLLNSSLVSRNFRDPPSGSFPLRSFLRTPPALSFRLSCI